MIDVTRHGSAAVIALNNPPVNAIGQAMRQALAHAFTEVTADDDIDRVILTGLNGAFAAGADAREFDLPPEPPHLPDVIRMIEACNKPVIAAVQGPALGGGYELALACRYRIATPKSQIGLPEVTLGIVPGAGGTQRLPRLVGTSTAVQFISEGRIVKGDSAQEHGLIDELSDDPVSTALALDLSKITNVAPLAARHSPKENPEAMSAARTRAGKRMSGQNAPIRAIELVELSCTTDFDTGAQAERDSFLDLRQQDQARALRHIFFAERGAKPPAELQNVTPTEINSAVVVGGGTMGSGIAYALNTIGIAVHVVETDDFATERAAHNVDRLFGGAIDRGLLNETEAAKRRNAVTIAEGFADLPQVDIAIEAVIEDMPAKKEVLSTLENKLPEHTVLATNTSYLDIDEIASSLQNPDRLLGLHFFSPAHIMKLLEIVNGAKTNETALATAFALAKKLRKIPVLAGVCDGFIGNRILARYREVADILLLDGALPWQIDDAMVAFGYAMGPYMAQDLSGLDIAYANRQRLAATRDPKRRYVTISDRMVEEGRLGRKASVGWYRYPGGGGAVIDPLLEDLIVEEAHFAKVTRRDFTDDEIRDRLLAAMINEACDILDEGIARSATDIDLVTVHGYGFPRWRGGLMHYAATLGFDTVLKRIETYAKDDPVLWVPSKKLKALATHPKNAS